MRGIVISLSFICTRCLRARSVVQRHHGRRYASKPTPSSEINSEGKQPDAAHEEKENGAMSRRLSQMSEENVETGGRSAAKAVEEAGFSEDLKSRLLEKIADANFRNDNAAAFSQVNMPASAGKGTRDIAAARPWTGQEALEDSTLRMLDDDHKPMRVPAKSPVIRGFRGPPSQVDTGRPKNKPRTGVRLANARDGASSYEHARGTGLSEEERQKFRDSMRARFQATARDVPATIQGLASLANERIEDAIARGQFKNLPRGKRLERDHNANSPFINTTEYLMNKMIQKQDIVPPWIEKQQELVSQASRFRNRLRADWRRHVARVISSKGGRLEKQVRLAEEYALAEARLNPPKKKEEKLNAINPAGHLSQITVAGELKVAPPTEKFADEEDAKVEAEIKVMEQTFDDHGNLRPKPNAVVTITAEETPQLPEAVEPDVSLRTPTVPPFRDAQWEQTERAYLTAAVNSLNSLARSYNLIAPAVARKPYYDLEREMKACFADVAPQIASAIREKAFAPHLKDIKITAGQRTASMLDQLSTAQSSHVHDNTKPMYGFKEFWRDLFTGSKT